MIALTGAILLSTSISFAQYDVETKKDKPDVVRKSIFKSLNFDYSHIRPFSQAYCQAAGPNINGFGVELRFRESAFYLFEEIKIGYALGLNGGSKTYVDVVSDITFEGGYQGGFDVSTNRWDFYGGSTFGYTFGNLLNVTIPTFASFRWIGHKGTYQLYEGQTIDPADLVTGAEAEAANSNWFGKNWNFGIRSGVELTWLPNNGVSLFTRVNYLAYSSLDVLDIGAAQYNEMTAEIAFPTETVAISSEWGFSIGVKLNFGKLCSSKTKNTSQKTSYDTSYNKKTNKPKKDKPNVILTPQPNNRK